ncbi:hypothetical protein CO083_03860 [Candidatus Roizmanbacteria bacterium CG_4_9_14_0_8_um_filter_34_12]|uniref:Uncharacterized protein n=1 Tax=Candidatus Roizmanbacteria bacterium CG_4_9_14_0_8_um_filter_34_12 TaxID=1974840 RepID=A0A2M8DCA2_9BACT|nr:MAG: hypothetical protein CO083_03860 [Candidatus Roizmanbacteria bacterium CG_4_9_14_0_8_um_filter_34_12]
MKFINDFCNKKYTKDKVALASRALLYLIENDGRASSIIKERFRNMTSETQIKQLENKSRIIYQENMLSLILSAAEDYLFQKI